MLRRNTFVIVVIIMNFMLKVVVTKSLRMCPSCLYDLHDRDIVKREVASKNGKAIVKTYYYCDICGEFSYTETLV